MQIDYSFPIEIKEVKEDGSFSGVASVYGIEDLGGDVIDKGAFKKTISENPTIPILWQHNREEVIGEGTIKEWQGKILIEGRLDLEDTTAQKAYGKIKKRLVKGLSIGYQAIKSTWEEVEDRMVRHISELKLWEVSIVTFPMLQEAQVLRVKSADDALAARIADLESKVSALTAAQTTPATPEPKSAAAEPQPQTSEPVGDHSAWLEKLEQLKGDLQWNL